MTTTRDPNHDTDPKDVDLLISRWEIDVVLSDGGTVKIRPILPSDAALIEKLHSTLSQETIYFRFFSPIPRLTETMLERFVNVDYIDRMAFVAILGESIIAVARYDRLPGKSEAEVAFLVSDAHQGRGLATIMLEMLAARASEAGITRFLADTLPDNQRMLRVFRDAGYQDTRSFKDGVVRVVFDIGPTHDSVQKMYERERTAVARSIRKILSPTSIAVVGASTSAGSVGNVIFRNILDSSFNGPVYPVNPHAKSVSSVKAYAKLDEIPDEVDLAIIVVPADEVLPVIEQAAEKHVGGLVIISSGFSEIGPQGAQQEREIVRFARRNGMRIVGPNCMGIANTDPTISLNGTLAPHGLLPGKASLIAHSGALGLAIVEEARRRGIGLSNFVSSGNRADVSGNDLLYYWEQDLNTDVILLYLESFGNPRSFVRIARRLSKIKPIVAVKAKKTSTVPPSMFLFRASEGHPIPSNDKGTLGAPLLNENDLDMKSITADEAVEAMFVHTGVLRVNSLEELFELGHALATQPLPRGQRVTILANTGGPASIAQDSLERTGMELAQLDQRTIAQLNEKLPLGTKVSNPIELPANAEPKFYEIALRTVLEDTNTDAVLALYVPTVTWDRNKSNMDTTPFEPTPFSRPPDAAVANATEVASRITFVSGTQDKNSAKTVLANFLSLPSVIPALKYQETEVPLFAFPETAAQALGRMWEYYQWKTKPTGTFISHDHIDRVQATRQIAGYLGSETEPEEAPRELGSISKEVFLSTQQSKSLLECYGIQTNTKTERTWENGEPKTVELEVQIVHDMVFGPFITIQIAGLLTDLLDSKATRVLPLRDLDAQELIAAIPGSRVFRGYRTIPPLDIDALVELVSRLGQMVENHFEIANMSLKPIVLSEDGYSIENPRIRLVDWTPQANYLTRGLS